MASYYDNQKNITSEILFGATLGNIRSEGLKKAKQVFIDMYGRYDPDLEAETVQGLLSTIETVEQMVSFVSSLDGMPENVKKYVNNPELMEKDLLSDGFQAAPVKKAKQAVRSRDGGSLGTNNRGGGNRYTSSSSGNRYSKTCVPATDTNRKRGISRPADANTECRYCHEMGHYIKDCPKLKDKDTKKNNNRSDYRKNGGNRQDSSYRESVVVEEPVVDFTDKNDGFPTLGESCTHSNITTPLVDMGKDYVAPITRTIMNLYPALKVPRKTRYNKFVEPEETTGIESDETTGVEKSEVEKSEVEKSEVDVGPPVNNAWGSKSSNSSKIYTKSEPVVVDNEVIQMSDSFDSDGFVKLDTL